MTDHTTPLYTPSEARAILRGLGCARLPALSTLRRMGVMERGGMRSGLRWLSLAQVVALALARGGTLTIQHGIVYPYGVGGGVWISPNHQFGRPCIEGRRVYTSCGYGSPLAEVVDQYEVTLAQAEAAHRWERACRGQA
jgi:uncharacterized protein (DUF433 family)